MTPIAGGDGRPPEPDWRTLFSNEDDVSVAHERWGIIIREMSEAGTLTVANGDAIRRLIEFRVQYERAARHVAEKGPILQTSKMKSKTGQWNPYWSVMRQAGDSIAALEAELGISPLRRGKVTKVQRVKKAPRAADNYLKAAS
jgi:P27 family predicted phage terminase small subunit